MRSGVKFVLIIQPDQQAAQGAKHLILAGNTNSSGSDLRESQCRRFRSSSSFPVSVLQPPYPSEGLDLGLGTDEVSKTSSPAIGPGCRVGHKTYDM